MPDQVVQERTRYISPTSAARKFDRGRSWVWGKVKSDASFPRPVYLDPKSPVFIEAELDAWALRSLRPKEAA